LRIENRSGFRSAKPRVLQRDISRRRGIAMARPRDFIPSLLQRNTCVNSFTNAEPRIKLTYITSRGRDISRYTSRLIESPPPPPRRAQLRSSFPLAKARGLSGEEKCPPPPRHAPGRAYTLATKIIIRYAAHPVLPDYRPAMRPIRGRFMPRRRQIDNPHV